MSLDSHRKSIEGKNVKHNNSNNSTQISQTGATPHKHQHDHSHSHSGGHHSHSFSSNDSSKKILLVFFLNLVFSVIEFIGGFYSQSMAILSDALHDFGDAIAILIAWYLNKKSLQKHNMNLTYGYKRYSTVGALFMGLLLVSGSAIIIFESVPRLWNQSVEPKSELMIYFALLGVAVNGFAALRLMTNKSLSEKMIQWHLIEDAIGWLVVLVGAIVIQFTKWSFIDPLLAIILSIWVIFNVVKNLNSVLKVFLQMTPDGVIVVDIENEIVKNFPQISQLHHTHVWTLDGENHILTTHIVLKESEDLVKVAELKKAIKKLLLKMQIHEATLEFEVLNENCFDPEHGF